jgi:Tol biopolymer transport system component/ABC-type branched-subunit amino acid transport system substrate-binding protein
MRSRTPALGALRAVFLTVWCLAWAYGGVALAAGGAPATQSVGSARQVVIAPGQPVQIAVALDDTGFGASFGPSAREAVQMAIDRRPSIRGFPIQLNAFNAPCDNGSPTSLAANAATANAAAGNAQNVAVIGHPCSAEASAWLPIYEAAGLVTINGSTMGSFVPAFGPTVFDGLAHTEPGFAPWYAAVRALPGDVRWTSAFLARFGAPPSDYADLYYDTTNVLLTEIQETARVDGKNLVIDSAALAVALRHVSGLPGVSCSITLDPATGYRVDDPGALARCASAASEIVFASDRATANPGEVFSLAAGRAPLDVSRSAARDQGAAVAPNGKLVAFWSDRTGAPRLYLARPDGSGLRLLPEPVPARDTDGSPLVFSPDGSRLLVTFGSPCKLFVVDLRSTHARRLGNACGPTSWSPDGARIVALVGRHPHGVVFDRSGRRRFSLPGIFSLWSAQGHLAVVNAAGTATVVVDERGAVLARLPEAAAGWSADGTRLALTRPGALLLADSAKLTRPRVLVRGPSDWSPLGVAFTPDGGFVRYQRASGDVVAIPVTGGRPRALPGYGVWARDGRYAFTRPLAPLVAGGPPRAEVEIGDRFGRKARTAGQFAVDDHGVSTLSWSANGARLLYEVSVRPPRDLWAVNPDGSNLHRLTQGPDVAAPAWSADGMRLAYTSAPFSGGLCGFCTTTVVIAGPDGRRQTTVPGGLAGQASQDLSPSWAPSGTRLVVGVCCSGEFDVVGVDGTARRQLAPGPAGDSAGPGVWSPDGATIAYPGRDGIDLIGPDGSGRRLLLAPVGDQAATALAWSHDGTLLAYSAVDGVHVMPADGSGSPRLLVAERSPGGLSFSPDDSQLVYAAPRQGPGIAAQSDLFVISLQGGPARVLASSPYDDTAPAWQPLPGS